MSDRRPARDGFVLVAVLWIMAALAGLVAIYAAYVTNTVQAFAESDTRLKAQGAISAALALTAYQLQTGPKERETEQKKHAPAHGEFRFRLGPAAVTARFVSEGAKIDLNAASKDLLAGLFAALGASRDQAQNDAERIVAWRSRSTGPNDEDSLYRAAGLAYGPRQGPYASAGELWLVRSLPPALVARALPYLTVFSGVAGIDPAVAPPVVLEALPGITPDRVQAILRQRTAAPDDVKALQSLLGPLQTETAEPKNKATEVSVDILFDNHRRVHASAVIAVAPGAKTPYRVLAWRDDLDGAFDEAGAMP